jgi:hypothetical protein
MGGRTHRFAPAEKTKTRYLDFQLIGKKPLVWEEDCVIPFGTNESYNLVV